MKKNYVIGFPRIGEKRELKFALEDFWSGKSNMETMLNVAKELRIRHWKKQQSANIGYISSNDFSLYDNMLDTAFMVGAVPERFSGMGGLLQYFSMARGSNNAVAMEMTKWFNTNYHYIVPELTQKSEFKLNAKKVLDEYREAKECGVQTKINLISPITFLALSKTEDGSNPLLLLPKLLNVYEELLSEISKLDDEIIVQFDEPVLTKGADDALLEAIKIAYDRLGSVSGNIKIAVVTYFEHIKESIGTLLQTPIWAIGLDFIHGKENLEALDGFANSDKKLIAGVINGRNIWRSDIDKSVELLNQISKSLKKDNILVGTSCSLLHVPYSMVYEDRQSQEIKDWLSYAYEKLEELDLVTALFFDGEASLNVSQKKLYQKSKEIIENRATSSLVNNKSVQARVTNTTKTIRDGEFEERIAIQREELKYPNLATTTIGSFPQTQELRRARLQYKKGEISKDAYEVFIGNYIDECVAFQEEIGLDVLVHGEPERNDMVEFFGELLNGYAFSQNGWVQSYGSRCVKPPFIYGDISRKSTLGSEWIFYAQSKTDKIVKGMLTGPVTMINWSFVREDIPKSVIASQIALAISDEIDDLQKGGIKIIQVDEAAFKEGYPLRIEKRAEYEKWAVESFKLSVSSANKATQIHTHMCYSEFNDIIGTIEAMDADVISIETARSGNELLRIFKETGYKQEIGPGIYDIHSPRVPSVKEMVEQIKELLKVLPKEQLWINPDCGLKTRKWEEVKPSLTNMVEAVKMVKKEL